MIMYDHINFSPVPDYVGPCLTVA